MRSRRHASRRLAAVLAAGVLTAVACGGDDDGAIENGAPVTAPTSLEPRADDRPAATDPPAADTTSSVPTSDIGDVATDPTDPTDPADATMPAAADAPEILQVTAPVVGGDELDLADYGDRPLLLWFWAPF